MPTAESLMALPLAGAGVYDLSDREVKKTRQRIYGINRENAAHRRYRTMREAPLLFVWRIR